MAVQPGLCRTWSETPKTGFLRTRLIYIYIYILFLTRISILSVKTIAILILEINVHDNVLFELMMYEMHNMLVDQLFEFLYVLESCLF